MSSHWECRACGDPPCRTALTFKEDEPVVCPGRLDPKWTKKWVGGFRTEKKIRVCTDCEGAFCTFLPTNLDPEPDRCPVTDEPCNWRSM